MSWIDFVCLFVAYLALSDAGELTFELPDNEKMCFHEVIDKGVKTTLEFQVITGGNYDVDMELHGPNGQSLFKDTKKQYETHTFNTDQKGEYKFCFSNEFSTFAHKVVYFDFQMGEEKAAVPAGNSHTAMTQMETSAVTMHEALKVVIDYQTHHKLREAQGRGFAEDLNVRTSYWSIGVCSIILVASIGQVLVLRSFFTDKRPIMSVKT